MRQSEAGQRSEQARIHTRRPAHEGDELPPVRCGISPIWGGPRINGRGSRKHTRYTAVTPSSSAAGFSPDGIRAAHEGFRASMII